ncbi:[histone H3]-lysine4 N-trimethyltransferase ASH1L [Entomortierella parvispora]|uniref:[histone H3]-lysine4 N-trimethyltransferase ASH1L n=1 Tax=Entomortierella parvispora TaxID=205924 RepID=A0A9P3H4R0_9FUNG|nr:[histone H3]-lysine4 N-trimethyltransferase ASH1L [Entomortierella parvispora]
MAVKAKKRKLSVSMPRDQKSEVAMLPAEEEMLAQMQLSKTVATEDMIAMARHVLEEITVRSRDTGLDALTMEAPVPEIANSPEIPDSLPSPTSAGIQQEDPKAVNAPMPAAVTGTRATRSKRVVSFDQTVPTKDNGSGSSDTPVGGRWLADLTVANMQRQNRAHEEQDLQERLQANGAATVTAEKTLTERPRRTFVSTLRSGLKRVVPMPDPQTQHLVTNSNPEEWREEPADNASSSGPQTPQADLEAASDKEERLDVFSFANSDDLRLRDVPIFKIDSSLAPESTTVPGFGVPLSVLAKPRLTHALIADKARTTYAPNPSTAMSSTSSDNGASTMPQKRKPGRPPGYFLGPTSCAHCRKSHRRCDYNTVCHRCVKAKIPCDRSDTVDRPSVIVREARIAVKAEAQAAVAAAVAAGWAIPIEPKSRARADSTAESVISEGIAASVKRRRTPSPSDVCRDNIIEQRSKRRAAVMPIQKFDPSVYITPKGNWMQRAAVQAAKVAAKVDDRKSLSRTGSVDGARADDTNQERGSRSTSSMKKEVNSNKSGERSTSDTSSVVDVDMAEDDRASVGGVSQSSSKARSTGMQESTPETASSVTSPNMPNLRRRVLRTPVPVLVPGPPLGAGRPPPFPVRMSVSAQQPMAQVLTPANQVAFLNNNAAGGSSQASLIPAVVTPPVKRGPGRPPWKYPPGFIPPPPPPKRSVGRPRNPNRVIKGYDANGVKRGPGRPPLPRGPDGLILPEFKTEYKKQPKDEESVKPQKDIEKGKPGPKPKSIVKAKLVEKAKSVERAKLAEKAKLVEKAKLAEKAKPKQVVAVKKAPVAMHAGKQSTKQTSAATSSKTKNDPESDSDDESSINDESAKVVARLVKKTYLKSGLYSSDLKVNPAPAPATSKNSTKPTRAGTRAVLKAPEHGNRAFPLPINYGATLLEKQRDFVLPYDIMHAWKHGLLRLTKQPEPFTKIRSNIFVERKRRTETSPMVCHCVRPPPGAGRVGCGEDCYNRVMFYECISAHCPCGDQCSNQRFQRKHSEDHLRVIYTPERGFGIQTLEPIKKGNLVIEYRGEVISQALCHERMEGIYKNNKNFYFLEYEKGEVVDACMKGTNARFVNHSCSPNSQIEKWFLNGEMSIGIFASQDIPAGAEISYDYNFSSFSGAQKQLCRCDAPNCRGYIGERTSSKKAVPESGALGSSSKSGKKKGDKRKGGHRRVHDMEQSSQRLGQMPSIGQIRMRQSDKYKLGKMIAIRYTRLFLFRNVRLVESKYVKYAQTKSRSYQDKVDRAWLMQARQCRKRSLDGVIDDLRAQALEREEAEQAPISEEEDDSSDDEEELSSLSGTPDDSIVQDEDDYLGEDLAEDNDNDENFIDAPEYPIEIETDESEDEDVVEVLEVTPDLEALSIYAAAKLSFNGASTAATTDFSAASSSSPNSASTDTLVEDTEALHLSKDSAVNGKAMSAVKSKKDYGPRRLRNRAA